MLLYGLSLFANAVDLAWVFLGAERMGVAAVADLMQQALIAVAAFTLVRGARGTSCACRPVLAGRIAGVSG